MAHVCTAKDDAVRQPTEILTTLAHDSSRYSPEFYCDEIRYIQYNPCYVALLQLQLNLEIPIEDMSTPGSSYTRLFTYNAVPYLCLVDLMAKERRGALENKGVSRGRSFSWFRRHHDSQACSVNLMDLLSVMWYLVPPFTLPVSVVKLSLPYLSLVAITMLTLLAASAATSCVDLMLSAYLPYFGRYYGLRLHGSHSLTSVGLALSEHLIRRAVDAMPCIAS